MNLLEQAIAAHGGIERWRALKRIELTLRCGGIAMALKGRPGILREPRATVDPRRPHGQFDRFGTFDGLRFYSPTRCSARSRQPRLVTIAIDDIKLD